MVRNATWSQNVAKTLTYIGSSFLPPEEIPSEAIDYFCERLGAVLGEPESAAPPYEYSFELTNDSAELRFFLRPWGPGNNRDTGAAWEKGMELLELMEESGSADLNRVNLVSDLFVPQSADALLGLCIAFAIRPNEVLCKVYFDPNAQGLDHNGELTYEALRRMGLEATGDWVRNNYPLGPKNPARSLSLDLVESPTARVKLYPHTGGESAESILARAAHIPETSDQDLKAFLTGAGADRGDTWSSEMHATLCWNFSHPPESPADLNIYVPANRHAPTLIPSRIPFSSIVAQRHRATFQSLLLDTPKTTDNGTLANPFHWVARKVAAGNATTFYMSAQEAEGRASVR